MVQTQKFTNTKWIHTAIIGFMALITLILFHEAFNANKMLISSDQIGGMGLRKTLLQGRADGQLSAWNSGVLGGMPTGDATIGDYLYPPTMPLTYFAQLWDAYAFKMILHVFLAGVFFYLMLLNGFKFSPIIAGIGAIFYMLNPQFFSHIYPGHDGKMFIIALLPLFIWSVKDGLNNPTIFKTAILGILVGLGLLTSHIQMMYFALWAIGAVWLFHIIKEIVETKSVKTIIKPTMFFWGGVFLGLMLGSLQFYPAFQFVQDAHSVRGIDRGFEHATSWSMHFAELMSLWVMEFGNWGDTYWGENYFKLNTEYVGAVATLLAVFAFVIKPTAWRIFWASLAVFLTLFSLGADCPGIRYGDKPEQIISIYTIFYNFVPGVEKFRANAMIMFIPAFVIVLLASLSIRDIISIEWNYWTEKRRTETMKVILISIGVITLISVVFASKSFSFWLSSIFTPNLSDKTNIFEHNFLLFQPALAGWWFIASTTLASIYALMRGVLKREYFLIIIFVVALVDMLRVDTQFIQYQSNLSYKRVPAAVSEVLRKTKNEPARSMFLPGISQSPNTEAFWGLESVNGFHDNELVRYREFRGIGGQNFLLGLQTFHELQYGTNALNLANCKYIFYPSNSQIAYLENTNALPRLAFTNSYEVFENREEISKKLENRMFDATKTVNLEQKPSIASVTPEDAITQCKVVWKKYTANHRIAEVEVQTDGILRISEVYYPAWKIFIDGKKADIINADIAFMATEITEGKHTIEMKIGSLYMGRAVIVFAIGIILVIAAAIRAYIIMKRTNRKTGA